LWDKAVVMVGLTTVQMARLTSRRGLSQSPRVSTIARELARDGDEVVQYVLVAELRDGNGRSRLRKLWCPDETDEDEARADGLLYEALFGEGWQELESR
jgi:hypothetical protein